MKNDLLHSMKLEQDIARSQLWNIFTDQKHTLSSFSKVVGISHHSLQNFFRGDNLTRKTMIKISSFLKGIDDQGK